MSVVSVTTGKVWACLDDCDIYGAAKLVMVAKVLLFEVEKSSSNNTLLESLGSYMGKHCETFAREYSSKNLVDLKSVLYLSQVAKTSIFFPNKY